MKQFFIFFISLFCFTLCSGQVSRFSHHTTSVDLDGTSIIRGIYSDHKGQTIVNTKQNILYKIVVGHDSIYTIDQLQFSDPIVHVELNRFEKNWIFTSSSQVYFFDENFQIYEYFKLHNQEFIDFHFYDHFLWALSKTGQLFSFQIVKGKLNGMFTSFSLQQEESPESPTPIWVKLLDDKKKEDEEPDNQFHDLYIDSEGVKWIASDQGLIRFRYAKKIFTKEMGPVYSSCGNGNVLWVGGYRKLWKVVKNRYSQVNDTLCIPLPGTGSPIYSITVDENGVVWFASDIVGKYDPQTEQVQFFDRSSNPEFNSKTAVLVDYDPIRQQVIVGTKGSGLYLFDALRVKEEEESTKTLVSGEFPSFLRGTSDNFAETDRGSDALTSRQKSAEQKSLQEKVAFNKVNLFKRLNFEADKSVITREGEDILAQLATEIKRLKQEHNFTVLINGHTSFSRKRYALGEAADSINFDLSYRRALAVKDRLIQLGVPSYLLQARGFGDAIPSLPESIYAEENQRVEIILQKRELPIEISNKNYWAKIDLYQAHFVNRITNQQETISLTAPLVLPPLYLSPRGLGIKQTQQLRLLTSKLRLLMQVSGKPMAITITDPYYSESYLNDIQDFISDFFYKHGFEEKQIRVVAKSSSDPEQKIVVTF